MNFDIEDWGLIDYQTAWDKQNELVDAIKNGERRSTLVLCSHPLVITMGRNSSYDNLVLPRTSCRLALDFDLTPEISEILFSYSLRKRHSI